MEKVDSSQKFAKETVILLELRYPQICEIAMSLALILNIKIVLGYAILWL
ncbi:hypothetical protein Hanom_Chr04g00334291 [Helianthus anomalus]